MPQFQYYGRNLQGEAVKGTLERNDKSSVADHLTQQKIIPVSINVVRPTLFSFDWFSVKKKISGKKVSDEQRIMFCRQMYTINKAGMPLAQGMKSLASSMTEGTLRDAVMDIVSRLQSGMSLSLAMRYHGRIFNELFISMVQVGEDSGNLDAVFLQLAHYIERDVQTQKSIKAVLLLLTIAGSVFFFFWVKTSEGKRVWDHKKLLIPVVGPLINKASLARYARSFSVMLKAGVPLTDSIGLCSKVIDNSYFSSRIETIKSGVERGDSLMRTHTRSGIFSPLILQMINVGENSGTVDTLLLDVAEYYDKEVEYDLKTLSAKIEPILIVVMAIFVLILALGIFLPMWEMYNVQQ